MTLYVLIMVCINGAAGCTYSAGHTLLVGAPNNTDIVFSYRTLKDCQADAKQFNERYNDPDLTEVCRRVVLPNAQEAKP